MRIVGVILLGMLVFFGFVQPILRFSKEKDMTEEEWKVKSEQNKSFYLSFLKEDVVKKMKIVENYTFKNKSSYLVGNYDSTYVFFHKVDLNEDVSLDKFVKLKKQYKEGSKGVVYAGLEEFRYSSEPTLGVDSLMITYDMNLLNSRMDGDRLMDINYFAKSSTFRFEDKGTVDMVFTCSDFYEQLPVNVVLLKKEKSVVIMVTTGKFVGSGLRHFPILDLLKS